MSGARILPQEGLPLGQEGGYPSNREGTSMQSSDTAWWEAHGVWGHPVLGANSGPCAPAGCPWVKHLTFLSFPKHKTGDNKLIPLWIVWSSPRKFPDLCKRLPSGGPQATQEALAPVGAQAWAGLPEVAKKWCQATLLPSARLLTVHHHLALRSPVGSLLGVNQRVAQRG